MTTEDTRPEGADTATTTDSEAQAEASAEQDGGAKKEASRDLDELLKSWDSEEATPEQQEKADTVRSSESRPVSREEFEALRRELADRDATESIKGVVESIRKKNEALQHVDPRVLDALLNKEAIDDPRVKSAFFARSKNKPAWASLEETFAEKWTKQLGLNGSDRQTTQDREALNAAVRGSSTAPPDVKRASNEKMRNMSVAQLMAGPVTE